MNPPIVLPKNSTTSLLFVVAGALLFNAIFWQEKLALNGVLFACFTVVALLLLYKNILQKRTARWMLLAVVVSLTFLLIYNSALSAIASLATLLLFTAYCKYQHRSPLYAAASVAQSFQHFAPQFAAHLRVFFAHKRKAATTLRQLRFALLPLLLVLLFFFIYVAANSAFANVANQLGNAIGQWMAPVLNWVQPQRLLFLIAGLFVTGGLLYRYRKAPFEGAEASESDFLKRQRTRRRRNQLSTVQAIAHLFIGRRADSAVALKYEYKAGLRSLVVLNLLLLAVNITDVLYVWQHTSYTSTFAWAEYVHGGTHILVASILLAMAVVLFFFRGNLNFFRSNRPLQYTAYLWLVQNAFLASSVCLRNYQYVLNMGLAYKRIGLFIFIALVLAGLVSVFIKIRWVKSSYYLFKLNAFYIVTTLVISGCFQWDVLIAKYNISHRSTIPLDTHFLLTLSDHALPVLQQHRQLFQSIYFSQQREVLEENDKGKPVTLLEYRIATYLNQQKAYTWLSWNRADALTRQQLQAVVPTVAAQKRQ